MTRPVIPPAFGAMCLFNNAQARIDTMRGCVDLSLGRVDAAGHITECYLMSDGAAKEPGMVRTFMTMSDGEAQLLLDALLDAGVKPTKKRDALEVEKGTDFYAGFCGGQQQHIEDLRRVIFGQPNGVDIELAVTADTPLTRPRDHI